ncbi:MAG: hypothetical protein U1F57_10010 [bacterium]
MKKHIRPFLVRKGADMKRMNFEGVRISGKADSSSRDHAGTLHMAQQHAMDAVGQQQDERMRCDISNTLLNFIG